MLRAPKIDKEIIGVLRDGGVGILPTDTIYGVVGSALGKETVERIYRLRQRNPKKPMVIIIGQLQDLGLFYIQLAAKNEQMLKRFWPGPVSIVLPCPDKQFSFLHRGTKALAFRLPKPRWLRDLLKKTGPLVATSANPENKKPAETIEEAKKYFGDKVDFYVSGGRLSGKPSTLIKIRDDTKIIVLREGAVKIKNF